MSSAMSRIQRAVEADRGIEQHQRCDQIRACGSQIQRDRTAERMPDHHNGPSASGVEQRRPARRRWRRCVHGAVPRRPAVAEQVGCEDREVGQVPRRQRLPAPAVPGQPVDGQDLRRLLGGPISMHVEEDACCMATASMLPGQQVLARPLVGPPWCHALMSAPHTALTPTALDRSGHARCRAGAGRRRARARPAR